MRKKIFAGNWKMNKNCAETTKLCEELKDRLKDIDDKEIIICPPFTSIGCATLTLTGTNIKVGAQNMYFEENGAFTGEISPVMLKDLGVEYVILGHSDRRQIFGEDDGFINKKVLKALETGLIPILCFGEDHEEKKSGKTKEVIKRQLKNGLEGVKDPSKVILAYEPIWAISRGDPNHKSATSQDAQDMHSFIRKYVSELYDEVASQETIILYGGSMKPENTDELNNMPDIDGGLIGGASLTSDKFEETIRFKKQNG